MMTYTRQTPTPAEANLAEAYQALGAYGVTTRRAPYILERARGVGLAYGRGEVLGERQFTVTWTVADGYTVTGPAEQAVADALAVVDAAPHADTAFLSVCARDYGADSTPAANLAELLALRQLADAVRVAQRQAS